MSSTRLFFLVLSCLAFVHFTKQDEECEPLAVVDLRLNGNNTLTWDRSPNEQCELGYYLVHVTELDGTVSFSYNVLFPTVHITPLERCKTYTFRVYQVSQDNVTGPAQALSAITPPASDANLHLDYVRLEQENRHVRLTWSLEEEYIRCARSYRVVAYNEDSDVVQDIYTTATTVIVNQIVPCGHYTFAVRALFTLEEEGPATVVRHTGVDFAAHAPHLQAISLGSTSVTFTWHLDELAINRCPMSALLIDAYPYFNATYPITNQINRTPLHLRLTGLSADTMYYLRVRVNNSAGVSAPARLAVQTQPSS